MSGMTVNRAVSSLKRNQAIFSREPSAAVSSVIRISKTYPRKARVIERLRNVCRRTYLRMCEYFSALYENASLGVAMIEMVQVNGTDGIVMDVLRRRT